MKLRVAKTGLGDAIQRRRGNDAAKRAGRAESAVVGHDQKDVWRTLRRHDARRPPRLRLRRLLLDQAAKLRIGRGNLIARNRRPRAWRARLAGYLHFNGPMPGLRV